VINGGLLVTRTWGVDRLAEKASENSRSGLGAIYRGYDALLARAKIIKIGDSVGICIPKLLLEQNKLGERWEATRRK
jgi:hypothetical protein